MASILDEIVTKTREDIAVRRRKVGGSDFQSFEEYQRPRRNLQKSLSDSDGAVSVIAEIKKASPSQGVIRDDFQPVFIAEAYCRNGASALSVLTDEPFFKGSLSYLQEVSAISEIPVLRKDFIVDFYQIEEARAWGADAVLLIVKITDGSQLYELHDAAVECGLQTVVECYDEADWERMDFERFSIAGVNNRNLETFEVDVHRGISMLIKAPDGVVRVSESGISKPADLRALHDNAIHSALIGEQFMRARDPGNELARFLDIFNGFGKEF